MHVLVVTSEEYVLTLYTRLLPRFTDWDIKVVHDRSRWANDIEQFIAGIPDVTADVIIVDGHNALLWRMVEAGPYSKPIIGCSSSYTPDFARRMLSVNIVPMAVPWSIDDYIELVETTVRTFVAPTKA